ncbi:MAG: DUF98 domain-containing protein [Deltaproteobacteria bacterium]|nr:DUF98 domain-containing protein [Deltaproteobacteria bacterium]
MDYSIAAGWRWLDNKKAVHLLKKYHLLPKCSMLISDDSLTGFLETINQSPVDIAIKNYEVRKIEKREADYLEVDASQDTVVRDVWLIQDGKKLVYARSVFPITGLNKYLLEKISASMEPLGRRLTDQGLLTFKDKLEICAVRCADINKELDLAPETILWAKHYRLMAKPVSEGNGIMASITEIFSQGLMGKPPQNNIELN